MVTVSATSSTSSPFLSALILLSQIFNLYNSKIFGGVLKRIDAEIKVDGFGATWKRLLQKTGSKLEIKNDGEDLREALKNDAALYL